MEEEPTVPTIIEIPKEQVTLDKGYYHGVYVILHFNNEDSVGRKEEQKYVEQDPDEEEMESVKLDDGMERHWRMVFEDNDGGVDDKKCNGAVKKGGPWGRCL